MVRALVYTDLQATEGSERLFSNPVVPLQRYRVDRFYARLKELYDQLGCNALWDLGDTTDDRISIPIPTLRSVSVGIAQFPPSPYNFKCIGNHEQYTKSADVHAGCLFDSVFNVVPGVAAFEVEDAVVIVASYPASYSSLVPALESLMLTNRRKPIVILGHLEVSGSKTKSGTSLSGMDKALLEGAQLTLLGHVHLPQEVGQNVYYIGSPFQQNFGEIDEQKRLALVEIDGDRISLSWVPLNGFPVYRRGTWSQFKEHFRPESEDRWEVSLQSLEDSREFYAHPFSSRARLATTGQGEVLEENQAPVVDWSLEAAARRYVAQVPPESKKLAADAAELLQFGLDIAAS